MHIVAHFDEIFGHLKLFYFFNILKLSMAWRYNDPDWFIKLHEGKSSSVQTNRACCVFKNTIKWEEIKLIILFFMRYKTNKSTAIGT
jgi:hypothetical protein